MKHVRIAFALLALAWVAIGAAGYGKGLEKARIRSTPTTYCNPVNISYRFMLKEADDSPSRREAADPTIVRYKDEYYLFASKSGCYWRSSDLVSWVPIPMDTLPSEDYAPTAAVLGDTMIFKASSWDSKAAMYLSTDPRSGKWKKLDSYFPNWDPCFFVDDDQRLYFYWGCSPTDPIRVQELDVENGFNAKGPRADLLRSNTRDHGWENVGENNEILDGPRPPEVRGPWIEGPWMTRHKGRYYLQYAAPGTEYASYADGVVVGASPMGPFDYAPYNPVCAKPRGFTAGAGHGSTFTDNFGNFWRVATSRISVKHMFERRLGVYPAGFDADGVMYTNTALGDYPHLLPTGPRDHAASTLAGWMLLTNRTPARASSSQPGHGVEAAFDEDIRTYWAAATGGPGEWLQTDMGRPCTVHALQVNFAEHEAGLFGRVPGVCHRYRVLYSQDGKIWETLVDRTAPHEDLTHEYFEFEKPLKARFIRLENTAVPGGALAVSGLRVFGSGNGDRPRAVDSFSVERDPKDGRRAVLSWPRSAGTAGYVVRFGIAPDKLYLHVQVDGETSLEIRSLNRGVAYMFVIDSYNENGITEGKARVTVR
ncbi:MAG: carbohydrate-binding protein [Acidobacteria bacterium]|nr:MAG: carbohydrate-binding protein [Acidobacteriota bacterium]